MQQVHSYFNNLKSNYRVGIAFAMSFTVTVVEKKMKALRRQRALTHFSVRILDILIASILMVFFSPLIIVSFVVSIAKNKPLIEYYHGVDSVDRSLRLVKMNSSALPAIGYLFDVFKGTISFCGVGILAKNPVSSVQHINTRVKAGVFSLSALHRMSGLAAYEVGSLTALTIQQYSIKHYVLISLRSVFSQCLYRCSDLHCPDQFRLFGVKIDNVNLPEAVDWVCEDNCASNTRLSFFVNVHSLNICAANPAAKRVINAADRVFSDGSGVRLGARS